MNRSAAADPARTVSATYSERVPEPLARRVLRRLPTRTLRRFVWDRIKYRKIRAVVPTRFSVRFHCNTRDYIQRYIYYFGVWEPNITAWVAERLTPGDTFVDVGSNIGYFSLLGAQRVGPTGRVVAVEASPTVFTELEANLALNGASGVRAICAAATNVRKRLQIYAGGKDNCGGSTTIAGVAVTAKAVYTEGVPLFELLSVEERASARLIKIDVEGAELDVIAGLHLARPGFREDLELIVEIAPDRLMAQRQTPEQILNLMREHGFNAYTLENDYRVRAYLHPAVPARPRRLRGEIGRMADVVFSRVDAEEL
jgi:FkbM family methyltransferase